MDRTEILKQLQEIFKDTFDNDDVLVEETTQASDIEEWDSLTHIMLIVAIEKHFNTKFNSKEILSWKNVGEMISALEAKK